MQWAMPATVCPMAASRSFLSSSRSNRLISRRSWKNATLPIIRFFSRSTVPENRTGIGSPLLARMVDSTQGKLRAEYGGDLDEIFRKITMGKRKPLAAGGAK